MALEKGCLCCNGVVIVGFLSFFVYTFLFSVFLRSEQFDYMRNDVVIRPEIGCHFTYYDYYNQFWPDYFTYYDQFLPLQMLGTVFCAVGMITSILLVIGADVRIHFLMLPWIIVNGIFYLIPCAVGTCCLLILGLPLYGPICIWCYICSAFQEVQENPPLPKKNASSV